MRGFVDISRYTFPMTDHPVKATDKPTNAPGK